MSDEDAANDAASDGGDADDTGTGGGRTAVVTKAAARPQRPSGKRTRQRLVESDAEADAEADHDADDADAAVKKDSAKKDSKGAAKSDSKSKSKTAQKGGKAKPKKAGSAQAGSINPIMFVYNYLKQVVAEMRKVIWPNRKQMLSYTSVVLVFLAFMVALVGSTDLGLSKLVLWVFG